MKVLALLVLVGVVFADPPFSRWTFCFDHVEVTNHPGPYISIVGLSGPETPIQEFTIVTTNKKESVHSEENEFQIDSLILGFMCEGNPTEGATPGEPFPSHDFCSAQSEGYFGEAYVAPPAWAKEWGRQDPARSLCCFAKNFKGAAYSEQVASGNYTYSSTDNGYNLGGNPYVYLSSDDIEDCPSGWRTFDANGQKNFCLLGRAHGMNMEDSCVTFKRPFANKVDICNNHFNLDGSSSFVQIGGEDGTFIATGSSYGVTLLLTNKLNEGGKHVVTVTAEDVLVQESISVSGSGIVLAKGGVKSPHCTNLGDDDRCAFGGNPYIYYYDACADSDSQVNPAYPYVYLTRCQSGGRPLGASCGELGADDCEDTTCTTVPSESVESISESSAQLSSGRISMKKLIRVHEAGVALAREIAAGTTTLEAQTAAATTTTVSSGLSETPDKPSFSLFGR